MIDSDKPDRFFTKSGCIKKPHIEQLATKVIGKAETEIYKRLNAIYAEIIFDEVQDISRAGLEVIKSLLIQSDTPVFLVGDSRQSLLDSDLTSNKNKAADRLGLVKWYQDIATENKIQLDFKEMHHTYRSNLQIAHFSDAIMDPKFGFPETTAEEQDRTDHAGVFLVQESDVAAYDDAFHPTFLRYSKASAKSLEGIQFLNFGQAKGLEWDHVAIYLTGAMVKLLSDGKSFLAEKSACGFYVAATRARYSLALIVPKGQKLNPHESFEIKPWPTQATLF